MASSMLNAKNIDTGTGTIDTTFIYTQHSSPSSGPFSIYGTCEAVLNGRVLNFDV